MPEPKPEPIPEPIPEPKKDKEAGFTVSSISGDTTEAGGMATFTVKLNSQPTANVTIGVSSSDTTEGTVSPSSLMFTSSNWNANQTVTVTGVDDSDVDGKQSFTVVLAVTNTDVFIDSVYSSLNPNDVSVTNTDDEKGGLFVIVDGSGTILTSLDGNSWRFSGFKPKIIPSLKDVTYGNGLFVVIGFTNRTTGNILTSPDGITWTERWIERVSKGALPRQHDLMGITYGNGLFVTVGKKGRILTSPDGISWTVNDITSGILRNPNGITYGNSTFVTVENSGKILTSSDNGTSWVNRTSGSTNSLNEVTYGNSTFVTVGDSGKIITSSDGTTWTSRSFDGVFGTKFYGVTYGNELFVIVGNRGTILTSSDGTSWTERTSGTNWWLNVVKYLNGLFIIGGDRGIILTSSDGISRTETGGEKITGIIIGVTFCFQKRFTCSQ